MPYGQEVAPIHPLRGYPRSEPAPSWISALPLPYQSGVLRPRIDLGERVHGRSTPVVQSVQFVGDGEARCQKFVNRADDVRWPHVLAPDVVLVDEKDTGVRLRMLLPFTVKKLACLRMESIACG